MILGFWDRVLDAIWTVVLMCFGLVGGNKVRCRFVRLFVGMGFGWGDNWSLRDVMMGIKLMRMGVRRLVGRRIFRQGYNDLFSTLFLNFIAGKK